MASKRRPNGSSPRTVGVLIASAAAVAVVSLWALRTPPPPKTTFQPSMSARPPVPRPPHALRVDLGSPAGRPFLSAGFGPDETIDGRTSVRLVGDTSRLTFGFAPDPSAVILRVAARSPAAEGQAVGVRLNGNQAGALQVGPDWTFSSVRLVERHFLGGANELELVSGPDLLLDWVSLEPESARVDLDLGAADARTVLTKGFTIDEAPSGRALVRLGETSRARVRLRPAPANYALGLVGRADAGPGPLPLQIFVNGVGVGLAQLPTAGGSGSVLVERERVVAGDNQLEVTRPKGRGATLERLLLEPISEAVLLDIGGPRGRAYLAAGFSFDETAGGTTCTWSDGPSSQLRLFVQPTGASYRLMLRAHAFAPVAPVVATLRINGRPAGSVEMTADFAVRTVLLTPDALRTGVNEIELSYSRTARPSSTLAGSSDNRDLAVRYDWVELTPTSR
jgi:hypothetical protein